MKTLLKLVVVFLSISLLGYLLYKGYSQSWTGFQGYINNKGESIPPKKLWDWLQLLIVPTLIAVGVWWLNRSQKKSEQQLEADKQRQATLEDYFDCMTDLLLKESLRDPTKNEEARKIARTRTLVIFRILDGGRKGQALQFLYESGLIDKNPIVHLTGADLKEAKLNGATLMKAEIRGVKLHNAQMKGADLSEADLRGSVFSGADLTNANMTKANLTHSVFTKAKLIHADLSDAILKGTEMEKAKLQNAKLPNHE